MAGRKVSRVEAMRARAMDSRAQLAAAMAPIEYALREANQGFQMTTMRQYALARLLVKKGLITMNEVFQAMQEEVAINRKVAELQAQEGLKTFHQLVQEFMAWAGEQGFLVTPMDMNAAGWLNSNLTGLPREELEALADEWGVRPYLNPPAPEAEPAEEPQP